MKLKNFTLIELLVAMAVFTILMLCLMQFFSSAQKVWLNTSRKVEMYENARIAMDLMCRELQCALYNNEDGPQGIYPFWHEDEDKINFISATSFRDSDNSSIYEIKYCRADGSTVTRNGLGNGTVMEGGWLVRSGTDDLKIDNSNSNDRTDTDNQYNFALFPRDDPSDASYTATMKQQRAYRIWKEIEGGTDGAKTSSQQFEYVIPQVVKLKITCRNKDGEDMRDKNGNGTPEEGGADNDYVYDSSNTASVTPFPYSIQVELTVMDKSSWEKWLAIGGNVADPSSDPADAKEFRDNHQITFVRTVYIGERYTN